MKKLRSGYTTGACAAAAAKGAALSLLSTQQVTQADIPFPDGSRVTFTLCECIPGDDPIKSAYAAVIKDAGDDPDVTNGAIIAAKVWINTCQPDQEVNEIIIRGGHGVGTVTKPGLAVAVGKSAINPIPLKMISSAVSEVLGMYPLQKGKVIVVEIIVPKGKELAEKTLNARLGIIGGISILGTTGIVRPVSAKAWTDTIKAAMDVAKAGGNNEIVLSTGRTSEAALEKTGAFQPEALIMMGDYLEYALQEAPRHLFTHLHMAGMWAKILKAALQIPQTHVRFGALEVQQAITLISEIQPDKDFSYLNGVNTAREIYERIVAAKDNEIVYEVCRVAKDYHEKTSGIPVTVYLVHHTGKIVVQVE